MAQHSLTVAALVPEELKLAALLHDAAETYVGDMVKPLKALLPAFEAIEERVAEAISQAFGIGTFMHPAIKRADLVALATEKRDLMPRSSEPWLCLQGVQPLPERILPLAPLRAKAAFLDEFDRLTVQVPGTAAA